MSDTHARSLRAVLFDVDFTLCRPGPRLGPLGYREAGTRRGLELDPERYDEARAAAIDDITLHPELDYDLEVWQRFTEDIVRGMGGTGDAVARVAEEIVNGWEVHENFELYDDALPTLRTVREHGFSLALVSNTSRDLDEFVAHHDIDVDAVVTSRMHGKMKPHPTIFRSVLALLDVAPREAVMVGDSISDDIDGAHALGMPAILIDRSGSSSADVPAIRGLDELVPLLLGGVDLAPETRL